MNKLTEKLKKYFIEQRNPVTFRTVYKNLIKTGNKQNLRIAMKELLNEGTIIKLKNGKYKSAVKSKFNKPKTHIPLTETFSGKIDRHPDGFGFFIPNDRTKSDVFIPKMKTNGAMHSDKVLVTFSEYRGKTEARVVKVVERGLKIIVGRVVKSRNFAHVIPFAKKVDTDIYLSKKYSKDLESEDIVLCEIINYGQGGKSPEAKIIRKLGRIEDDGIENEIVLAKYELERSFPESVIFEVDSESEDLLEAYGERTDLKKLFTVTIDGASARDFDDAISINKDETGFTLFVHIADVSHYVKPETNLDIEAFRRGTSVYFPEFAIPMLPEKLSNGLCSLMPRVKRLTMTAEIQYDIDGNRIGHKIYNSIIRSNYRLTYDYVNDYYDKKIKVTNGSLKKLLNSSKQLASLISARRKKQGTIDFELPESEFCFDDEGELVEIKPLSRGISHRLIEMFMIDANEVVAEFLEKELDHSVFRIHGHPDKRKLAEFVKIAHLFGVDTTVPEKITPEVVQQMSILISKSGKQHILGSRLVRTMQKAIYSIDNIGHFGLSSKAYTHFTSPIRRYPDLMVHRLLKNTIFSDDAQIKKNDLKDASEHCSDMEQKSEEAEREIHLFKKLKYLDKNKNVEWETHINRVNSQGVFVYIEALLMTGFVPVHMLDSKDMFQLDSEGQSMFGRYSGKRYTIGDNIKVQLEWVNYDKLETVFSIVS